MSNVAIITARGGSKRIPRKNIKNFCGKPIIAYSIQHALESDLFDEVMVSTDDKEIAKISKSFGAVVPFMRSQQNADEFATTTSVLLEVFDAYQKIGKQFDYGCCIYPTAPFANSNLLLKGFQHLQQNKFDVVFPAMKFGFPIQRAIILDENQKIQLREPEFANSRSQDLKPAYHDTGQFYWFDVKKIQEKKKLWTNNTGVIIVSEMQAQDIDYPEDWDLAELKYKRLNGGQ